MVRGKLHYRTSKPLVEAFSFFAFVRCDRACDKSEAQQE